MSWQDVACAYSAFLFGTRGMDGYKSICFVMKQVRELEASHTFDESKRKPYFQKIEEFFKAVDLAEAQESPMPLSTFGFSRAVNKDLSILMEIRKEKENCDKIPSLMKDAFKLGFSRNFVEKVAGETIEEKFTQYVGQHNEACSICQDEFEKKDFLEQRIYRTVCKHFFHQNCIEQWIKQKSECPTCRGTISFTREKNVWTKFLQTVAEKIKMYAFANDKQDTAVYQQEDPQAVEKQKQKEGQYNTRERQAQERSDHECALRLHTELNG